MQLDNTQYTGELAFLAKLVPQMHIDLDKIYASSTDKMVVKRKVTTYYKGLRGTLKGLNENQFAAFDKAFAEYNSTKKAE
jgi:serine/threonine-protein kinase